LLVEFSGLDSPSAKGYLGFVLDLPEAAALDANVASVILDRVQDACNAGSILRSAAGMGAHFALKLVEGVELEALDELGTPIVVTSSHQGSFLHEQKLPMPCAWAMGHEGQGVSDDLMARASLKVRIDQPGGEESLNVAAAAAICLYASTTGRV
jgi:TrmH family RNA methyltransferase